MKTLLKIILGLIILLMVGCVKTEIVVVSMSAPSNVKGSLLILRKGKIKVFNPTTGAIDKLRLRGMHIIHKEDLETFYQAYLKSKKAKKPVE